jgi:hypothetical protein
MHPPPPPRLIGTTIVLLSPPPAGHAVWLDPKQSRSSHSSSSNLAGGAGKTRCLILWRRLPEVAADIANWAANAGVSDSVMLVDELSSGPEVRGTGVGGGGGWQGVLPSRGARACVRQWRRGGGGGKCHDFVHQVFLREWNPA